MSVIVIILREMVSTRERFVASGASRDCRCSRLVRVHAARMFSRNCSTSARSVSDCLLSSPDDLSTCVAAAPVSFAAWLTPVMLTETSLVLHTTDGSMRDAQHYQFGDARRELQRVCKSDEGFCEARSRGCRDLLPA